jgi:hypothetical protein
MAGVVFSGQSGCLLPSLIILNLLFGRVFFRSPYIWLGLEVLLIVIFCVKAYILACRLGGHMRTGDSGVSAKCGKVVDVEGEVVEDKVK